MDSPSSSDDESTKTPDWFKAVKERFQFTEPDEGDGVKKEEEEDEKDEDDDEDEEEDDSDDSSSDEDEEKDQSGPSKKQARLMSRPTLAHLKTLCSRPEVVEIWDCTAYDPLFLVYLKSYRNLVGVPIHWCNKRNYMQGKRGIDKTPYVLPEYIEATKISEIRSGLQERENAKSLKQKQREKVRPKSHRMDIDYQVLHDAFFKYASKPRLTKFGDVYYEGKEAEMKLKRYKTGQLDERLKEALGMADNSPPPWLINMQRYGPPPSYPTAKIPGLNAPIPAGAEYGYLPGQWGKPPVDQFGRPLYGDFTLDSREEVEDTHGNLWGEIGEEEEEMEEDEEAEGGNETEGNKAPAPILNGTETPYLDGTVSVVSGAVTGGGSSVYSGSQTPSSIDITKRGIDSATPKPYQVLQEHRAPAQPGALFQSNTIYKIPTGQPSKPAVGGNATPYGGTVTPYGGSASVIGGVVTPFGAGMTGGLVTPYAPGIGGLVTPAAGMDSVGGIRTPAVGGLTSVGDGEEFAADNIRQQLRKFESASEKATKAAGQISTSESQKRKKEETTAAQAATAKKKKKKEFKF